MAVPWASPRELASLTVVVLNISMPTVTRDIPRPCVQRPCFRGVGPETLHSNEFPVMMMLQVPGPCSKKPAWELGAYQSTELTHCLF